MHCPTTQQYMKTESSQQRDQQREPRCEKVPEQAMAKTHEGKQEEMKEEQDTKAATALQVGTFFENGLHAAPLQAALQAAPVPEKQVPKRAVQVEQHQQPEKKPEQHQQLEE